MFAAEVERLMLGEVEELWDSAAIAMLQKGYVGDDEFTDYQASAVHRR